MKFDIENKILATFISIVLFIIVFLGSASYLNGYELLISTYEKKSEEKLSMLEKHLEFIDQLQIEGEEKNSYVDDFLKSTGDNILIIRDGIIAPLDGEPGNEKIFELKSSEIEEIEKLGKGKIENDNGSYVFENYEREGLTVIYVIKKDFFYDDLVSLQKNILLIAIVSLIFSMQAIIFTAHHLSRPLKKLADSCIRIANGAFDENITIKRKDEIGVLSKSFNEMLKNIRTYTREIEIVKEFNEDILKNIPLGIMTFDEGREISSENEAAKALLKNDKTASLEGIIKKQVEESFERVEKITKLQEVFQEDGSKLFFDVTTNLMERNEGGGAICIFSDITERKKIEERIERLNRLTSMGQVAAGLAHEIRNPLTGMKASIYVIKKRLIKDKNYENDELLNVVLQEIERLNILVSELLDFTKQRDPIVEEISIDKIMEKIKHLTIDELNDNNISINFESYVSDEKILFDKGQLEQILLNLIYNSIDAIESNGKIDIFAKYEEVDLKRYLTITVKDNGCGIDESEIKQIFNPFFTRKPKGTGLGLSVVQKLVEENNGEIRVKSVPGEGTTFEISFLLNMEE